MTSVLNFNCGYRVAQKRIEERFMQFVNWPAPNSLSPHVWWGEGWGEGLLHSGFAFGRGYAHSLPPSPLPSPPPRGRGDQADKSRDNNDG